MLYERTPGEIVVSAHWPLAFESGVWTGRLAGVAGAPVLSGRYSAQWVKNDARWFIRSEVFVALDCTEQGCSWPAAVP
jgi:hypothetical protein